MTTSKPWDLLNGIPDKPLGETDLTIARMTKTVGAGLLAAALAIGGVVGSVAAQGMDNMPMAGGAPGTQVAPGARAQGMAPMQGGDMMGMMMPMMMSMMGGMPMATMPMAGWAPPRPPPSSIRP